MLVTLHVNETHIRGCCRDSEIEPFNFVLGASGMMGSDELGLFIKSFLRDRAIHPDELTDAAVASVVPDRNFAVQRCFRNHFGIEPFFLKAGARTGVKLKYKNPAEIGPDRIACAMGACRLHPDRDLVVAFFDTALKFLVLNARREYLGDLIMPGVYSTLNSLERDVSDSMKVEMEIPGSVIGRSVQEAIQSGVYLAYAGAIREILVRIEASLDSPEIVRIGTGRFSKFFEHLGLFDCLEEDLVHHGLAEAYSLNRRNQ